MKIFGGGGFRSVFIIILLSTFCTVVFHVVVGQFCCKPITSLYLEDSWRNHGVVASSSTRFRSPMNELEQGLGRARAAITINSLKHPSSLFHKNDSRIYRNPTAFFRSYKEMEKRLKIYVYEEGEVPLVHDGPCKDIYSSEGRFIHEMENISHTFRTRDPDKAHLFFMPFSVVWMVKYVYIPNTYDMNPLKGFVSDYVNLISIKHSFWNRSQGADHFMVSCHDWGPEVSKGNRILYKNSIRVLCNANSSEGFDPQKDVSLPEIALYGGYVNPKLNPNRPYNNISKSYLGFFAGGSHGPIRPVLLNHWKDKDSDLKVTEHLNNGEDYYEYMLKSKFCLCPSGHEVASPRIVESIYAECVPVILSDYYVLPFSDVLRWESFSVQVGVSEIPRLKEILEGVSEEEYLSLMEGLRSVRRHFVLNRPVKRYDMFSMILHSVWLRRLNLRLNCA